MVDYGGLRFGGLNGSWRYKPRGPFLYDQGEVARFLGTYPPVGVLVAHNSPSGIHDRQDGIHVGFDALVSYIRRVQPRLVFTATSTSTRRRRWEGCGSSVCMAIDASRS